MPLLKEINMIDFPSLMSPYLVVNQTDLLSDVVGVCPLKL